MKKSFMDKATIDNVVARISREISNSYPKDEPLVLLAVNQESFPFAMDLANLIRLTVILDSVDVHMLNETQGMFHAPFRKYMCGCNVILVSYDGYGVSYVKKKLHEMFELNSVKYCTLMKKKKDDGYHHFLGKTIPGKDLQGVGYGKSDCEAWNGERVIYLKKKKRDDK